MLKVELDRAGGIALLEPGGELSARDFVLAAEAIDPYIEQHGRLNGVIIHTKRFPGWDSFSALLGHLRFIREHHARIARVALVTDSRIGNFAQRVARHFVAAEVETFPYNEFASARNWVESEKSE